MGDEREGYLDPETTAWIQEEADKHHDGVFGAAAAAILRSAREAEQAPEGQRRWAYLEARMRHRPDSARFSGGSQ